MGSNNFYPEERPVHRSRRRLLDGRAPGDRRRVPTLRRGDRLRHRCRTRAGPRRLSRRRSRSCSCRARSSSAALRRVDLRDFRGWWAYVPGACWRSPEGPGSDARRPRPPPRQHVAYEDAEAYANWAGKALPTEAEWEFAARGGLEGAAFVWGDEFAPGGRMMANTWQGDFPGRTSRPTATKARRRWELSPRTATACTTWPATSGSGPPTSTRHTAAREDEATKPCCTPGNRARHSSEPPVRPGPTWWRIPRKVRQGRLAPVRAELLPALPTGGPPG